MADVLGFLRRTFASAGSASKTRATALAALVVAVAGAAEASEPVHLKIVGGLAGVSQYAQHEEPFWRTRIGPLSGGRIQATIHPSERSGMRGADMLQLMRLGVAPFGVAILSQVAADEPELNAVDLPGLNPDITALRMTVRAYRPRLEALLRERYGIELLGVYTYPAQVLFCAKPFASLDDLARRRVRTSSVGQSELVSALGATPVMTPFSETVSALSGGVVDCAITGSLSGVEIGLASAASHVGAMALGWGVSIFGVNGAAWAALPADVRGHLRTGVAELEREIWEAAERETERGFACATGATACGGRRAAMTLVPVSPADETRRRRLLVESVLPRWIERCGAECAGTWNGRLAPIVRVEAKPD